MVSNEILLDVVKRLEQQVRLLQEVNSSKVGHTNTSQAIVVEAKPKKVYPYTEFWNAAKNNLSEMLEKAKASQYPEELTKLTLIAIEGVLIHQDILESQHDYPLPSEDNIKVLQTRIIDVINKINPIIKSKPELNSHGQAITYGINSLLYCTISEGANDVAQQYSDMIDNHKNKIFLSKNDTDIAWVKAWKDIFIQLVKLVKIEYKAGLMWNGKSTKSFEDLKKEKLGNHFNSFLKNNNFSYDSETVNVSNTSNPNATASNTIKLSPKFEAFVNESSLLIKKLEASNKEVEIKGIIELNNIYIKGIKFLVSVVTNSKNYKFPTSFASLEQVIKDLSAELKTISNPELNQFIDVVSNIFTSFYWITKNEMCLDIAQAYIDMSDTPSNRILMKKIPAQSEWVKATKSWNKEILKMISLNYKFGLEFSASGSSEIENLAKIDENNFIGCSGSTSSTKFYNLNENGLTTVSGTTDNQNTSVFSSFNGGSIDLSKDVKSLKIIECSNIKINVKSNETVGVEIDNSSGVTFIYGGKEYKA